MSRQLFRPYFRLPAVVTLPTWISASIGSVDSSAITSDCLPPAALTVFGASGPMPWIIASPCSGRSAEAAGGAPAARRPGHGPLRLLGNLLGAPALLGANFRVEIVRCYLMRPRGRDRERTTTQLRPAKQTAFNPSSMRLTARLPFGAMANDRMGMIGHYRGAENTPAAL